LIDKGFKDRFLLEYLSLEILSFFECKFVFLNGIFGCVDLSLRRGKLLLPLSLQQIINRFLLGHFGLIGLLLKFSPLFIFFLLLGLQCCLSFFL
jgi:hypothetical protein